MEQEFLSVREFATKAGVSVQAVYKRLSNTKDELSNYVKLQDGKKVIDIKAVFLFKTSGETTQNSTVEQPVDNQLIEILRIELEKKNEQIENLQRLLSQEQQLRLVADRRILLLEEKASEAEKSEEQTAIRPWWQFWKNRKEN